MAYTRRGATSFHDEHDAYTNKYYLFREMLGAQSPLHADLLYFVTSILPQWHTILYPLYILR